MLARLTFCLAALICSTAFAGYPPLPPAEPPYYRVQYEGSTNAGELRFPSSYTIWLPPGVEKIRGIIVHQHGCGEGACIAGQTAAFDLHYQTLAKKHHCALLGPAYQQPEKEACQLWCDPRNGSGDRFLQAIDELAEKTGHAELRTVPWAIWGHSGGAVWTGTMLILHPDRFACAWLRSGAPKMLLKPTEESPLNLPDAALTVPIMCNLGTREGITFEGDMFKMVWPSQKLFFEVARSRGGLIGVAVDPKGSHEAGNTRYLAIPWFDAILTARLPENPGEALKPMPAEQSWVARLLDAQTMPETLFSGDTRTSVWLPNETVAKAYSEYVTDANVSDATPPPAPADLKLTENILSWTAEADLESGISHFLIYQDGKQIAQVPEKHTGNFGRKVFQVINYSDTPTQPLKELRYKLTTHGTEATYEVITVNSIGLQSLPSAPLKP
ncbi:alpha/beta hydrolase family protein [Lacunimicrobium album]